MATYDYDVLYLGSGHGTFDGAIPLAQTGKKVGIIESRLIGGTCPNRGCNAKIILDAPVELQRASERLKGIVDPVPTINWKENVEHKQEVIDKLPVMISGAIESAGIDIIKGYGTLLDAHTIEVDGQPHTAEKLVISTGLRPNKLDIPGTELSHDSEDFMNLKKLPERIAIIGSGYISLEFATIANAAGSKVTVFMHGDQALRQFNQDYVTAVVDDLERRGVKFVKFAGVSAFEKQDKEFVVKYADGQQKVDWILDATGRIPNVENIGLDKVGVKYNKHGIEVNDYLQTTVDNIYASGDVIDKTQPKLTPTAIFESMYLTNLLSGQTDKPIDYPVIPSVVFTSPRIAKAGVSVEEAKQKGYKIVENHLTDEWYRQIDKQDLVENAFIYNEENQIVGVTEVSERADDVINAVLPLIEFGLSDEQIGRLVYLFPSITASTLSHRK
ncbi:dihydrolipoyl dehydrogenase family protein [Lentilactobacillus sp. SPB1-3]|uniref:NAD(P)/FAD-dependent oxidoreductase n=1 Tax=Lentilactobacillus terminaliae TaxID=3003483 RepID=A0ACD5DEF6_9LACO|nr:NAD(P)/FAD-dependent oxidoreductase [Lentilactobacillus sp. SPB1-3]MCZ0977633.1 NAD(P)/FAD-dependent oxidoreductase [Lentilactobacillus sp. SPB1-3]